MFEKVVRKRQPRKQNSEPIAWLYTRDGTRRPGQVMCRLRLTRALLLELGWPENQRLDVCVGLDEDAGKVQVSTNPTGSFRLRKSTPSGTSFVLASRLIPVPAGINRKVGHSCQNGTLIISFA